MRRLFSFTISHGTQAAVVGGLAIILSKQSFPSFAENNSQSQSQSKSQQSQSQRKCPVSFLWNWSGSSSQTLPAGHPVIKRDVIEDEKPAVFNTSHFPKGVNANFLDTNPEACAEKYAGPNGLFECEYRQIKKYAPNIINSLRSYGLQEGSCVGDVGAGTGVLTRLLSQVVGPKGVVLAEEISPSFLSLLAEEKKKNSFMSNVILVEGTNKEINFPIDKKCDLIIVCDVYHHFEYPLTTLRNIKKSLKPNGKLVVIDFHKDESKIHSMPKGWVTDHVRASQEVFRSEIESVGFHLLAEPVIEGLTENYCMVFSIN